jgi:hypothetical protein
MKLDVNLGALWENTHKMGAQEVEVDLDYEWANIDLELDVLLSTAGIEIDVSDVETKESLFSYKERQVLFYIPDHSFRIKDALDNPSKNGRKYHVAECKTMADARLDNDAVKYKVSNNIEGIFDIYGSYKNENKEGRVSLNVCQNCLKKLNYKNAANETYSGLARIVEEFSLSEFFSTYSSLFKYYPKVNAKDAKRGYSKSWKNLSRKIRKEEGYCCSHCKVCLKSNKGLLHTHHINREKSDNDRENLIPLCVDCHRKQPFHGHMQVKHAEMKIINQLRREQGLIVTNSWSSVYKFADPASHGVISHCQKNEFSFPEIGFQPVDGNGEKIADVELAWPHKKTALVLDKKIKVKGWRLFGLDDAVQFFGKER